MKEAILLLNMGGARSVDEVELFLRNMFADPHILPMYPILRNFMANIIIAKRLDEAKEVIEYLGGASPLLDLTQRLATKISQTIQKPVYPVMRYVPPFGDEALTRCKQEGIERLILFPMYPQYSTTTTLSSTEDILRRLCGLEYEPEVKVIDPYFDNISYLALIGKRIREALGGKDPTEYQLILSAHGLPKSIIEKGDPYQRQVEANASALKIYLELHGMKFADVVLAYQSKVGNAEWLEPSLAKVLRNPKYKKVLIYPISFTIDNSETLYELAVEHKEIADKLHYDDYIVAKCFNDEDDFVTFIVSKTDEGIGGNG